MTERLPSAKNFDFRQALVGTAVTLFIALLTWGAATVRQDQENTKRDLAALQLQVQQRSERLAVLESQVIDVRAILLQLDSKLNRLLERQ
jgi:hypothetical protein